MFKKRWAVVVQANGVMYEKFWTRKEAESIVHHFNTMAATTGFQVRFKVKDLKKVESEYGSKSRKEN